MIDTAALESKMVVILVALITKLCSLELSLRESKSILLRL